MRGLKTLVVGLGMLVVIGMGILAWGIYRKATDPDFRPFSQPAAKGASFGEVAVRVPEGCRIVEMRPQGERLYLRLDGGAQCQRVVVVDTAGGTVLARSTRGPKAARTASASRNRCRAISTRSPPGTSCGVSPVLCQSCCRRTRLTFERCRSRIRFSAARKR